MKANKFNSKYRRAIGFTRSYRRVETPKGIFLTRRNEGWRNMLREDKLVTMCRCFSD